MKHYICKYCGVSGTRPDVRLHLKNKHGIRGQQSQLTKSTKAKEIE